MNEDKKFQPYHFKIKMSRSEFDSWARQMTELQAEMSDIIMEVGGYQEANEVINYIKNLK